MKKTTIVSVFLIGVMFLSGCGADQAKRESAQLSALLVKDSTVAPARPAEINGIIVSLEGNKIVVKNEVGKEILSEEEREKKKEKRQGMTQEERQASRTQETESIEVEEVALEIPVGTMILKGYGNREGGRCKIRT